MGRATGVFSRVTDAFFYMLNGELVTKADKIKTGSVEIGVHKYTASDLVFHSSLDVSANMGYIRGILMNDAGTKLLVVDKEYLGEYDLSTAFDLSTASFVQKQGHGVGVESTGMDWVNYPTSTDILIMCDQTTVNNFAIVTFGTPLDVSTISKASTQSGGVWGVNASNNHTSPSCWDGGQYFAYQEYGKDLIIGKMSTPGDLSTASRESFNEDALPFSCDGLKRNKDGTWTGVKGGTVYKLKANSDWSDFTEIESYSVSGDGWHTNDLHASYWPNSRTLLLMNAYGSNSYIGLYKKENAVVWI